MGKTGKPKPRASRTNLWPGSETSGVPASLTKANFDLFKDSKAITDYKEFPERSHFTIGEKGWETVADYAIEWAVKHAAAFTQKYPSLQTTETSRSLDAQA